MGLVFETTLLQFLLVGPCKIFEYFLDFCDGFLFEVRLTWNFLLLDNVCQTKAIGTENTTISVNEDSADAKIFGDGASVLGTSTTEDAEDVVLWIETTSLGEGSDWTSHCFVSDFDEAESCFEN